MKIPKLITALALSASLRFAAQAQEETPVEMKDLPPDAQTTIKEKAGSDQIVRIAKEIRKGKECYDAVVNRNGKEMAIPGGYHWQVYWHSSREESTEGKCREILTVASQV